MARRRRPGRPAATPGRRSANRSRTSIGAVEAVGRKRRHAPAQQCPGHAIEGRPSPIAAWPPQPWTWTSTKPGAINGAARVERPTSGSTRRSGRPSTVIRPPATSLVASTRRPANRLRRHRSAPAHARPAACSAPWTAAPIAPAHVPSSARTISTPPRSVVRTRRPSSARMRLEQQVAGGGDAAADDHPVRRRPPRSCWRCRSRASDRSAASPAIAPGVAARGRSTAASGGRRAAGLGETVGPDERLEAAAIAAAARRARPDRSSGGRSRRRVPSWPWYDPAVDRDDATDSGARASARPSMRRPDPRPSRSSASPNARASLISATGQPERGADRRGRPAIAVPVARAGWRGTRVVPVAGS